MKKIGGIIAFFTTTLGFCINAIAVEKISLKGSDTIGAKLMPRLIEAYKAETDSEAIFEVEDKGSSTAFSNLLKGSANIGMSSRKIKDEERDAFTSKGLSIVEHVAATDMIAVVVNQSNSLEDIELFDVEAIFTGDVTDWSELGGKPGTISAYTRNTASGTYKSFQKIAMNKRDYGEKTQKMEGNEQIANEIANNKNGVGYIGLAYTKKSGLKKLTINGVEATPENANNYPIARNLYYYTVGELKGEAKKFLDWICKSDGAKKVIEEVGFIAP